MHPGMSLNPTAYLMHRCFLGPCDPASVAEHVQGEVSLATATGPDSGDGLCTWKAEGSMWVAVRKGDAKPSTTTVRVCGSADCYLARESCTLPRDVPPASEFLAQVIVDEYPDGTVRPVVMVHDVIEWSGSLCAGEDPRSRYARVRDALARLPAGAGIQVHWAGDRDAAKEFCAREASSLPHEVECLFALTDNSPFEMTRI